MSSVRVHAYSGRGGRERFGLPPSGGVGASAAATHSRNGRRLALSVSAGARSREVANVEVIRGESRDRWISPRDRIAPAIRANGEQFSGDSVYRVAAADRLAPAAI